VSQAEKFRARAAEHAELAETCPSEEVREIRLRLAASFLALADNEEWLNGARTPC
jgi:hypothetical protein